MQKFIFKIFTKTEWQQFLQEKSFHGSIDDLRDGFIHLSTQEQLPKIASRFFSHQSGLMLAAFDAATLGKAVRFEANTPGGTLYPHFYGVLKPAQMQAHAPLPLDSHGIPQVMLALDPLQHALAVKA